MQVPCFLYSTKVSMDMSFTVEWAIDAQHAFNTLLFSPLISVLPHTGGWSWAKHTQQANSPHWGSNRCPNRSLIIINVGVVTNFRTSLWAKHTHVLPLCGVLEIYICIFFVCFEFWQVWATQVLSPPWEVWKSEPKKYITVIIDGMDLTSLNRPSQARICGGYALTLQEHWFIPSQRKGSWHLLSSACSSGHMTQKLNDNSSHLNFNPTPKQTSPILYLQLDNTARENKNKYVF